MAAAVVPPDQLPPLAAAADNDNDNDTSRADSRGGPSLALADLLLQRSDLVPPAARQDAPRARRRSALVPGCRLGHDVLLLSSLGYDVVGLDADPDVIRLARENAAKTPPPPPPPPASGASSLPGGSGSGSGSMTWLVGDFLAADWLEQLGSAEPAGKKTFDLVYDYMVRVPASSPSVPASPSRNRNRKHVQESRNKQIHHGGEERPRW